MDELFCISKGTFLGDVVSVYETGDRCLVLNYIGPYQASRSPERQTIGMVLNPPTALILKELLTKWEAQLKNKKNIAALSQPHLQEWKPKKTIVNDPS